MDQKSAPAPVATLMSFSVPLASDKTKAAFVAYLTSTRTTMPSVRKLMHSRLLSCNHRFTQQREKGGDRCISNLLYQGYRSTASPTTIVWNHSKNDTNYEGNYDTTDDDDNHDDDHHSNGDGNNGNNVRTVRARPAVHDGPLNTSNRPPPKNGGKKRPSKREMDLTWKKDLLGIYNELEDLSFARSKAFANKMGWKFNDVWFDDEDALMDDTQKQLLKTKDANLPWHRKPTTTATPEEIAFKEIVNDLNQMAAHYRKGYGNETIPSVMAMMKLDIPFPAIKQFYLASLKHCQKLEPQENQQDVLDDINLDPERYLVYVNNIHENESALRQYFRSQIKTNGVTKALTAFLRDLAVGDVYAGEYQPLIAIAYAIQLPDLFSGDDTDAKTQCKGPNMKRRIYYRTLANAMAYYATTYNIIPCVAPLDKPFMGVYEAMRHFSTRKPMQPVIQKWNISRPVPYPPGVDQVRGKRTQKKIFMTHEMNKLVEVMRTKEFVENVPNTNTTFSDETLEVFVEASLHLFLQAPNILTLENIQVLHAIRILKPYMVYPYMNHIMSTYWRVFLGTYALCGFPDIDPTRVEQQTLNSKSDFKSISWRTLGIRSLLLDNIKNEREPSVSEFRALGNRIKGVYTCMEQKLRYPYMPFEAAAEAIQKIGATDWPYYDDYNENYIEMEIVYDSELDDIVDEMIVNPRWSPPSDS